MQEFNNVKKRETSSIFEYEGRKFEIRAFDPMEGTYILTQLLAFVLPLGIDKLLGSKLSMTDYKQQNTQIRMSKEDFIQFQVDVLKNVYELFDVTGQKSPVVRENGSYGIADLTVNLLIQLIVATLAFNFKDFFEESPFSI